MKFDHVTVESRHASIVEHEAKVVVEYVDQRGKAKTKGFAHKSGDAALWQAKYKALRFLFGEGFGVLRSGTGNLQWLVSHAPHPYNFEFATGSGSIWLTQATSIGRLDPATGATTCVDLHQQCPRAIEAAGSATVGLVDYSRNHDFPDGCASRHTYGGESSHETTGFRIFKIEGGVAQGLVEVLGAPGATVIKNLSLAEDGSFVGPHPDGAALYDATLDVVDSWPVGCLGFRASVAALSPKKTWIALLAENGSLCFRGVREHTVDAGFEDLLGLTLDDDGVAWVAGRIGERWGTYRVDQDGARRVSERVDATPSPDGKSVIEVVTAVNDRSTIVRRDLAGNVLKTAKVSWALGPKRRAKARLLDEDTVVIRCDTFTLAGIRRSAVSDA